MSAWKTAFDECGKPVDRSYLKCGLPDDLRESIDKYIHADTPTLRELLSYELTSDINSAQRCEEISGACAQYLRERYLSRRDYFSGDWFGEEKGNG